MPILLFLVLHHHQQSQVFPLRQSVSLRLFLLVFYCQQPQVLPIASLDLDKLVVVFVHKHPTEWPLLVYSKFQLFLLSLFSIFFHNFWTFIQILYSYLTSPTTSNISLIHVATNFVMNFFLLISSHYFAYIINHKQSY